MAVEKKTFTGGLTTDLDAAYLRPNQYLNALNIRVSSTEDGSQGVVSNIKGNTKVTFTMPSGTNTCIGSHPDEENARIFYFIHNSNDDHLILCYFHKEDTIRKVIDNNDFVSGENGLEFTTSNLITGVGMNDDLLFFTDGATEPKRINVERALRKYDSSYTQLKSYDTLKSYGDLTDGLISVMRPSPLYPLTTSLFEDTSRTNNLIRGNSFTFAYRFVYVDGEVSGLSPYSQVVHHLNPDVSSEYDSNTIELTIPSNQSIGEDVNEIEFLVRYNDETGFATFFVEKDYDAIKDHDDTSYVTSFANDSVKLDIPAGEVTRYFSAVPVKAKALECARGRVFMGNTTEGYDNINLDQLKAAFNVEPQVKVTASGNQSGDYKMFKLIEFNDSANPPTRTESFYRFVLAQGTTSDGFYEFSGHGNPHTSSDDEVTDWTSGSLNSTRYPSTQNLTGLTRVSTASGIFQYVRSKESASTTRSVVAPVSTTADTGVTITGATANVINLVNDLRVWKTASSYQFALAFCDKYGRAGTIIELNDNNSRVTIPRRDSTYSKAVTSILWDMDEDALKGLTNKQANIIPEWAHTFQFLRTKSLNKSFFITFATKGANIAYTDELGTSATTNGSYSQERDKYIRIDFEEARLDGIGYNYSEGDILYIAGLNNADRELVVVAQQDGYIYTEAKDVGSLKSGSTYDIECEIYSPTLTQSTQAYYEFGEVYKITNPGASNRTFSVVAGSFDEGDVILKKRVYGSATLRLEQTNPDTAYYKQWIQLTGRVFATSRFGQVHKENSISFSENRIQGTLFNGLSTFNSLDEETLPQEMGSIQKLLFTSKTESVGNVMLAIGVSETASVYIGEAQISTAGGAAMISVQTGVIGSAQVLRGSYGTMHPESVVQNNNRVYYFDAINGTAVLYDVGGLRPIGDSGIRSFFRKRGNAILVGEKKGCFGGFDATENEYILSLPSSDADQEYFDDYIDELSNEDVLDGNTSAYNNLNITLTGAIKKGRKYRVEIGDQVGLGQADDTSDFDNITIKYSDNTSVGTTSSVDKGGFKEFVATQDSSSLKIVIADSQGVPQASDDEMYVIVSEFRPLYYQIENGDAITLAFSESVQAWTTRYSYTPEFYGSVSTAFVSFKSGELWLHNTNSTRNSFYGTSYKSQIATTTRDFPSAIKSFSFIAIEGNIPPSFIHMRTTGKYMDRTSSGQIPANPTYSDFIQSSDLSDSEFVQKEGHYYAPILRDRLEPAPSSYNATTYSTNSLTGQKLVNQFLLFMLEFDTTSKIEVRFADIGFIAQRGHNI